MLATSEEVKRKFQARDESFKPLAGKTMSMIFQKPSMRTRLSFETVRLGCAQPLAAARSLTLVLCDSGFLQARRARYLPGAGHH